MSCRQEMGDDAILSPEQEEAGLKAREISKQESAVVDKSQELVNEPWIYIGSTGRMRLDWEAFLDESMWGFTSRVSHNCRSSKETDCVCVLAYFPQP